MKMNLMLVSGKYGILVVAILLVIYLLISYFGYVNIGFYVLWVVFAIAGYLAVFSRNIGLAEYFDKKSKETKKERGKSE